MQHISKNQIKWIRSLQLKKCRDAESVFVAEGHKCIEELLKAFEPVLIVSSLPDQHLFAQLEATAVEIEQMSSLRAPQGCVAVFHRSPASALLPATSPADDAALPNPDSDLILALDGVQDPGNLGTIIRTADWFGIRHIVCSPGTADCFNPKVVQATMGALARVQIHYTPLPQWLSGLPSGVPIFGTLLDGKNIYHSGAIPHKRYGVILMGNEGNGLTPEVRSLVTHPLFIPPYPADAATSESLNVSIATAVILAEFRRQ